jgi:nucleoside 2-deoxyribosyltransferase
MAGERALSPRDVYERDAEWVRNCDALIAEVSVPSHGVGYEIAFALAHGKPVLCIAESTRRVSKMITGNSALRFEVYSDLDEAAQKIGDFLSSR